MYSHLTSVMADVHSAELRAQAARVNAAEFRGRTGTHSLTAAVRRYFGHALETDQQPLRGAGH